jgi:hypothetical protein
MKTRGLLLWIVGLTLVCGIGTGFTGTSSRPHYRIDAQLDVATHTIRGNQVLTWTNTTQTAAQTVVFQAGLEAFKHLNTPFFRQAMLEDPWWTERGLEASPATMGALTLTSCTASSDGRFDDIDILPSLTRETTTAEPVNGQIESVFRLELPESIPPGDTVVLTLEFNTTLSVFARQVGFFDGYFRISDWYPRLGVRTDDGWIAHPVHYYDGFVGTPSDYDVSITVPTTYTVVASGAAGDPETTSEESQTLRFRQERIVDFGWIASPDLTPVSRRFEYAGLDSVTMRVYTLGTARTDVVFDAMENMLKYYGLWYGSYPYPELSVVALPPGHPVPFETASLMTAVRLDRHTAPSDDDLALQVIQGCGYQYWGGIIPVDSYQTPWMRHGLNAYSCTRVFNAAYGYRTFSSRYFNQNEVSLPLTVGPVRYPVQMDLIPPASDASSWQPIDTPLYEFTEKTTLTRTAQNRAALMLWTFEGLLGEERFSRAMKQFAETYRFVPPSSGDFLAGVLSETDSASLTGLFKALLTTSSAVDLAVHEVKSIRWQDLAQADSPEMESAPAEEWINTVVLTRAGHVEVPVEVRLTFENGDEQTIEWMAESPRYRLTVAHESRLLKADVDPDRKLWLDTNGVNNCTYRQSGSSASWKWGAFWMSWLQHVLEMAAFFS